MNSNVWGKMKKKFFFWKRYLTKVGKVHKAVEVNIWKAIINSQILSAIISYGAKV